MEKTKRIVNSCLDENPKISKYSVFCIIDAAIAHLSECSSTRAAEIVKILKGIDIDTLIPAENDLRKLNAEEISRVRDVLNDALDAKTYIH